MIDVFKEHLLDFKTAARLPVFSRGGHSAHISKIHRCHRPGIKGPNGERVRLEAIRTPGGWMTSHEAIQRWVYTLTTGDAAPTDDMTSEHQRAEAELATAGFYNPIYEATPRRAGCGVASEGSNHDKRSTSNEGRPRPSYVAEDIR